ncbi:hypothetical protein CRN75_03850 [Yersinia frederiksenii]|nr:hypothetical protein CRN75_03850 [Yersinia frederiksenii]
MQLYWLFSITRITYRCKFMQILAFAAFLHLEIYRLYSVAFSGIATFLGGSITRTYPANDDQYACL